MTVTQVSRYMTYMTSSFLELQGGGTFLRLPSSLLISDENLVTILIFCIGSFIVAGMSDHYKGAFSVCARKVFCVRKVWSNFQCAQRTGVWRYLLWILSVSGVCFTKFRHQSFSVISKKKLTAEKMLRTVRKVADAENGSAFLNMQSRLKRRHYVLFHRVYNFG